MERTCELVAVQKAVCEVPPTVGESTANLYELHENGSSTSTYLPPAIVSIIVYVILSVRGIVAAVVIRGLLWVLAVLIACVAWVIGHIVLSCVHCESIHSTEPEDSEDRPVDEVEIMEEERRAELDNLEEDKSAEVEIVTEQESRQETVEVMKEEEEDNGDVMELRRRRRKSSDSSTSEESSRGSGCGASSCSTLPCPCDEKFDDLLPIELLCSETCLKKIEEKEECTSEIEEQRSPISPICLTNEVPDLPKSRVNLWVDSMDAALSSEDKNDGQESDTSDLLGLQTSIRLQQILDLAALRAFRESHRQTEHPSDDHLTSLVGLKIDVKKPNMDLLNSIIGI